MTIQDTIARVVEGKHLARAEAAETMRRLMQGEATQAQIGALLTGLRIKGETVDELTGFAETMRTLATPIATSRTPLVDTCGTGGDHSGTFNISTTAAFVVSGAGVAVAKHGNRSASSQCGSADVLEALGVTIEAAPERVGRCIDEVGIGFLFARSLHGAMKQVAGARSELKIRTVFNLLGPLTNPAGACGQVVGVFDASRAADLAQVLANLGTRHAFVVAGSDGLDEITLGGATTVAEARGGKVDTYEITPDTVTLHHATKDAMMGGSVTRNAHLLRAVLEGEVGPHRDIVLFNAAAGVLAGDLVHDWLDAVAVCRESIDSGAARGKLDELIAFTR